MHIRYFIGYVYHICLQDTIQSTLLLCLLCQAMLLPMPLRHLLLTTPSGFMVAECRQRWAFHEWWRSSSTQLSRGLGLGIDDLVVDRPWHST